MSDTYVPEIEPAAARLMDEADVPWGSGDHYFERKEDGFRCLLHLPPHNRMFATGRNRLDKGSGAFAEWAANVPHLTPVSRSEVGLTVLDGEVLPPAGVARRMLAGVLNVKDPAKAAEWIKANGEPQYVVFDVLHYQGTDLRERPAGERREWLPRVLHAFWRGNSHFAMSDTSGRGDCGEGKRFYLDLIARGGEGVMCKELEAPYGKGWYKVKRKHDIDVFITGYKEAKHGVTGKYTGLVGALAVSVCGPTPGTHVEVAHVSGFDDETRRAISGDQDGYRYRVLTIRAQEMDGKGRLMHPRFKEWRPDLDMKACTWQKLERDLAAARGARG